MCYIVTSKSNYPLLSQTKEQYMQTAFHFVLILNKFYRGIAYLYENNPICKA